MKRLNVYQLVIGALSLVSGAVLTGCSDDDADDMSQYQKISLRTGVNPGSEVSTSTFIMATSGLKAFDIKACAVQPVGSDVTVEVTADASLAKAYDQTAEVLPEGSYTLSSTTAVIKQGATESDPVKITITDASKLTAKLYVLPVTIKTVSGIAASAVSAAKTVFVKVYVDFIAPSGWTLIDRSKWKASQTGAYSGTAAELVDNLDYTGWLPEAGGQSVTFTLDKPSTLKGMCVVDQNRFTGWGYGYSPNWIQVSVHKVGETEDTVINDDWIELKTPTTKAEELQYVPLPVDGQIDRITIEAGYGYRGFAELFFYQ